MDSINKRFDKETKGVGVPPLVEVITGIKAPPHQYISKLSNILDFVIYSNVYISIVAATITYVLFKLVDLPINYVVLIPFFIMLIIYSFNRKTDVREDAISNPKKSIFNKKYNKYILSFAVMVYGLIILLSFIKGAKYGVAILVPLIIGVLYSKRIALKSKEIRLKDILFLKNLVVAFTWAYITIILPSLFLNLPLTQEIYFLGSIVFFRVLIDEIFFDIKDVDGDSKVGVRTVPAVYGVAFTDKLLIFLNIAFTCAMFVLYWIGNYNNLLLDVVLFTAAYGFFYLLYYKISSMNVNQLSDVIVDGEYIATGAFVYFLTL